jgi:DNA mismatch repair ATPase MutS
MNPKELASHIVSILFPLLKLDSIQQIGKEFKSATDQSIHELWEIVKPWFIEEIENGEDAMEAKGAIKSGLRKELAKNENLKKEVEKYIEQLDSTPKNKHSMSVTNSHGVIQGNISVGRDLNFNKE